nr:hypothetical protein [Azospirillum sp. INR13]
MTPSSRPANRAPVTLPRPPMMTTMKPFSTAQLPMVGKIITVGPTRAPDSAASPQASAKV